MKTALAIVSGLVCVACVYVYVRDTTRHRQEMAEMRAELEAFQRSVGGVVPAVELRRVRAHAGPEHVSTTPAAIASPAPADALDDSSEQGMVLSAQERQAHAEAVVTQAELAFAAQGVDESWAGATARSVYDVLSSALPTGASMRDVDCRTSLCRVELAFRDEASRERFESDVLFSSATWRGGFLISHEDPASARVYLAREGHDSTLAMD